jgi:hypothetical protein
MRRIEEKTIRRKTFQSSREIVFFAVKQFFSVTTRLMYLLHYIVVPRYLGTLVRIYTFRLLPRLDPIESNRMYIAHID